MIEPAPCSVNSSSRVAFGARPSRITTARTPPASAASAVSVLGIMPPEIVPSVVISRICPAVRSVITSPCAFLTPATSVSSSSRSACNAAAMAPAAVSPFTLNVSPFRPMPRGAMTGMMSALNIACRMVVSQLTGVPTRPSDGSVGSQTIRFASLPDSPTPLPPCDDSACTIRLFTRPESTISTTSTVASSVTRLPFTNSDLISSLPSISLIMGPPPWTITGFTPTWRIRTISRAKVSIASSSPMA